MNGTHITEAIWFNARKVLPDSNREVIVVFKSFNGKKVEKRISQARFLASFSVWEVDSKGFNPSIDIVTQWAEIDINRGGFMPDDFPVYDGYEFISNKM